MENQAFLEITGYLMEALPYGMLWMDQAGNIVFANQKIAQEAGYTRKELRGMQIYDINPRTDPEAWRRHWEILTRDKSNYFKTYHQKKDGTFYAVEVHAYFFSNMRNQYICALIRDISQSYLYRQLLEQTEASAQVGGWEWDLEAQDLIASQESLKIFQVADSQELIPNRLIGKFPGEQGEAFQAALQQVLRQGQEANLILQGQIKANLKKWIHLTARPVYQNQQIIKVIGTYQDISQVKEREQALEAALAEIQRLQEQISAENEYLQQEVNPQLNFPDIICQSPAYRKVLDEVERVAPSDTTVLVTGETGTGKELLARAIHQLSRRSQRALIKVNCAAIPKNLIESELFGHRKGAFTGAVQDQIGRFELADQGTIFLDEIGELPLDLQPKLLRVLQEGEFERIGDPKTKAVDVRVISATNRDLKQMVKEGKFREDLYYRLEVFPIHNIPLRERSEDIPLLAQYFLEKYRQKIGRPFSKISPKVHKALRAYSFPGNIRELENLIERALILEEGPVLKGGSWLPESSSIAPDDTPILSLDALQKKHILEVLKKTKGRVSGEQGAAKLLEVNAKTLFAKMKKLGIGKGEVFG